MMHGAAFRLSVAKARLAAKPSAASRRCLAPRRPTHSASDALVARRRRSYVGTMSDSYTANLIGSDSTDTVELEFINGLPQKSFVRPIDGEAQGDGEEVVWELVPGSDSDAFEYRVAGIPGADYS